MPMRTPVYGPPAAPSLLTLKGVRFLAPPPDDPAGGGGGGGGTDPAPTPPAPSAPTPPAPAPAPAAVIPVPGPPGEKQYGEGYVSNLRGEAKGHRERADAEKSRADAAEQRAAAAEERIAAADYRDGVRTAAAHTDVKGDADLLLDSSKLRAALKDVDMTDAEKVRPVVQQFVKDNPRYGSQPTTPGSSGPGRPQGAPTGGTAPKGLEGAVAAAMGPRT